MRRVGVGGSVERAEVIPHKAEAWKHILIKLVVKKKHVIIILFTCY